MPVDEIIVHPYAYFGFYNSETTNRAVANIAVPVGFKATHVEVHASASTSRAVEAWDYNYTDGERVQVYTGGAGQFDFNANTTLSTEVVSSTTKDLLIKVMPADNSTLLFGATVTIVAV